MGAGYNSRAILAAADGAIDVGYTLGAASASEVCMAAAIADQYGINHHRLSVTDEYLTDWPSVTQYTNGLRESIHIHHRGQNDALTTETIHHGLLLDTLLRGGYLPSPSRSLAIENFRYRRSIRTLILQRSSSRNWEPFSIPISC